MPSTPPSERPTARRAFEIAFTGGVLGVAALAGALSLGWLPLGAWSEGGRSSNKGITAAAAPAEASSAASPDGAPRRKVVPADERTPGGAQIAGAATSAAEDRAATDGPPEKGYAVPRTPTPQDELALVRILQESHELELGEAPSELRLGVAWAHISLEHERGKAIECNNFGNLSVWEREPGPHYVRILKERRRASYNSAFGRWRWVEMRFRAFDTPVDGARAYWRHLQDHYAKALVLFSVGDGYEAGLKLARDGYATANPTPYADSISDLAGEYKLRILPQL